MDANETFTDTTNIKNPTSEELLNKNVYSNSTIDLKWTDVLKQILASFITALTVIHVGLHMSFSAVLIPQLEDSQNEYSISKSQSSWIASLLVLTTPFGSLISGPISDRIGRKKANMLSCVPTFLSWLIIAFAPNTTVQWLYFARILAGLGGGMTTTFIVYVSEICNEKYRAMMLSLNSVAVALGILVITINAVQMSWRTMALTYSVFSLVTFVLVWLFTPESPYWLMVLCRRSDNRQKAEKALKWLNPNEKVYNRTMLQILSASRTIEGSTPQIHKNNFLAKIKKSLSNLTRTETRLPILLITGLMSLQQLSGGYAIIFYTIHIFKKIGGKLEGVNEYNALLIMGIIRFSSSSLAAILSRIMGRKPLLFISSSLMAATCFTITIYQYFLQNTSNSWNEFNNDTNINMNTSVLQNTTSTMPIVNYMEALGKWPLIVCVLIFVGAGAIGLLNIPWTLIGELLPTSIRGSGSGFIISFSYVIMFIIIKLYPFILDSLDIGYIFLIQGIICILSIIYVYLFIPETFGKSLQEIERHFANVSK